jgi:hypothetical protein
MSFRKFLTPRWVDRYADIYRKEGFKGVMLKGGLWLLVGFILFYLIRDSILYLLIPYLITKGIIKNF